MTARRRWVQTGEAEHDEFAESQRRRIADATWELIATVGLAQTSMRKIADRADCTTGLVTHYFANKQEVMLGALERVTELSDGRIRSRASAVGLERLRHLAAAVLPLSESQEREWRVWLTFWATAYTDERLERSQREIYERWRSTVELGVREAVEAGELPADVDILVEADILASLLMGVSVDIINRGEPSKQRGLEAIERQMARLVEAPIRTGR